MAKRKKLKKLVIRELKKKKTVKKPKKVLIKKKKTVKKAKKAIKRIPLAVAKQARQKKKKIVKHIVKHTVARKKPTGSGPRETFLDHPLFKAKIKVIGIGGGGGSIVSEIGRSLDKATFVVADTDVRAFRNKPGIKDFAFGQKLTHGLGTGVNPELGKQAAESEKERIAQLFRDQDIVIFIASLGGGLASGATQVFADVAKQFNGITFGIFTLPFKFEGKNKYKIALRALKELRKNLNVSITIPNEKIFKIIQADTAITDAFSTVNRSLIESLESLIDLISNPGIINIDFADVRAILSGRGNLGFLNTTEASGKDRLKTIGHDILHNPLYQYNNFTPEKILFNIAGGNTLSMFEVNEISKAVYEHNPKAKIIFGISKNPKYKNKIKATILMTGEGEEIEAEEPKIAEVKKPVAEKPQPKLNAKAVVKKPAKAKPKINKKKIPSVDNKKAPAQIIPPVFEEAVFTNQSVRVNLRNMDVVEVGSSAKDSSSENPAAEKRKPIRRTALDIKKEQENREKEQSLQEKEWEIPAFLRFKNK
jgi:cell division protein FtsZ